MKHESFNDMEVSHLYLNLEVFLTFLGFHTLEDFSWIHILQVTVYIDLFLYHHLIIYNLFSDQEYLLSTLYTSILIIISERNLS